MQRKALKTETLYFEIASEQYFYTPSGEGVIWLTPQEADNEFGWDVDAIIINKLSDF